MRLMEDDDDDDERKTAAVAAAAAAFRCSMPDGHTAREGSFTDVLQYGSSFQTRRSSREFDSI